MGRFKAHKSTSIIFIFPLVIHLISDFVDGHDVITCNLVISLEFVVLVELNQIAAIVVARLLFKHRHWHLYLDLLVLSNSLHHSVILRLLKTNKLDVKILNLI